MSEFEFAGEPIPPGVTKNVRLKISERTTGDGVFLPVTVVRAHQPGPRVFLTGVVHGDELNGLGIIHELMFGECPLVLERGTLFVVPVVNILGFESQMRYMPDRRDLNRCFPGSTEGSMTSRVARAIFDEIICRCDFGIDLHTAATGRINYPNVRGDMSNPGVRQLAKAFGCELMVHGLGPEGSLRRSATDDAKCPTIILEAGEPGKIEPAVVDIGTRGVRSVLSELQMLSGSHYSPPYQTRVNRSTWVRAETGGILRFHVTPGMPVDEGQPVATNVDVFGRYQNVLVSPIDGVVLGMTVLPAVQPGEPVCHIAVPRKSLLSIRKALRLTPKNNPHRRVRSDLATSIAVSEREVLTADDAERDDSPVRRAPKRRRQT